MRLDTWVALVALDRRGPAEDQVAIAGRKHRCADVTPADLTAIATEYEAISRPLRAFVGD